MPEMEPLLRTAGGGGVTSCFLGTKTIEEKMPEMEPLLQIAGGGGVTRSER